MTLSAYNLELTRPVSVWGGDGEIKAVFAHSWVWECLLRMLYLIYLGYLQILGGALV